MCVCVCFSSEVKKCLKSLKKGEGIGKYGELGDEVRNDYEVDPLIIMPTKI